MTNSFWLALALIVGINLVAGSAIIMLDYVLRLRMTNEQLRNALVYAMNN
jgi:hypothetical protein